MDNSFVLITRTLLAFIFTLSLFGLVSWLIKRYGGKITTGMKSGGQRLQATEWRMLDARHRLVLVRRDDREHLLLISQNGAPLLIEGGIPVTLVGRPEASPAAPMEPVISLGSART